MLKRGRLIAIATLLFLAFLIFENNITPAQAQSVTVNTWCNAPQVGFDLTAAPNILVQVSVTSGAQSQNSSGMTDSAGSFDVDMSLVDPDPATVEANYLLTYPSGTVNISASVICGGVTPPTATPTATPPAAATPFPEPAAVCPAGMTEIGGTYHENVRGNIVNNYNVVAPVSGSIMVAGWAMEGHPEQGCLPDGAGQSGNCVQNQLEESFVVQLNGVEIGQYLDKQDASRQNYWFEAGPYSTSVAAGNHQISVSHLHGNWNSVDYKLVACFSPDTNTPIVGFDYGDAPASYGEAQHQVEAGIALGAQVDVDVAPNYSANATGDDLDGQDDEDGIAFPNGTSMEAGETVTLDFVVTNLTHNDDFLLGWADWDQNGSFDADERIIPAGDLVFYQSNQVQNGSFSFTVPDDAVCDDGNSFVRLRYVSDSGVGPTEPHHTGEAEDYTVQVTCPVIENPFVCDAGFYQVINGHLKILDPTTGRYEPVGNNAGFRYNSMAYNENDNFMYAIARSSGFDANGIPIQEQDFIRINANGEVFRVGPTGIATGVYAADFIGDDLWVRGDGTTTLYRVDKNTGLATRFTTNGEVQIVHDLVAIGNVLYGVSVQRLYRIDVSNNPPTVTSVPIGGDVMINSSYGSAWVTDSQNLYASSNEGGLYLIEDHTSNNPRAVWVTTTESTSSNDGSSCPSAPPPNFLEYDYGDAPNSYDASFSGVADSINLWLGPISQRPDTESVFGSLTSALEDDLTGVDDEDGVIFNDAEETGNVPVYYLDQTYSLDISAYNDSFNQAFLEGWVDFGGDNSFDAADTVVSRVVSQSSTVQSLAGQPLYIPSNAACGMTYARFRISNQSSNIASGYGGLGETEDYALIIDCKTDLEMLASISPQPSVQLSDYVTINLQVRNNGPNPARAMTVDFTYPIELDDVSLTERSGWICSYANGSGTCTKTGLNVGVTDDVAEIRGRVPGTYPHDQVSGSAEVSHENHDHVPANNIDTYSTLVDKDWHVYSGGFIPFLHAEFADDLQISAGMDDEADFYADEFVVSPLQLPLDFSVGLSMTTRPTITTVFCHNNSGAPGCDEATDIIAATYAVKSYTSYSLTLMEQVGTALQPDSGNLLPAVQTILVGGTDPERYTEVLLADCQDWSDDLGGACVAHYDIYSTYAPLDQPIYDWDESELTRYIFQTSGGRAASCDPTVGLCYIFDNSKPGIYQLDGIVGLEIVVYDPVHQRLNTAEYRIPLQSPYTFYLKMIAAFTEPEDN